MPWQAALDTRRGIVAVSYDGHATAQEIRECVKRVIELLRTGPSSRVLMDLTATTRVDLETTDIVDLPALYQALGLHQPFRQAIVVPPGCAVLDAAAFYETVCTNRGHEVRLFPDRARALAWLALGPAG
jgi:hypothetical protein